MSGSDSGSGGGEVATKGPSAHLRIRHGTRSVAGNSCDDTIVDPTPNGEVRAGEFISQVIS